MPIFAQAQAKKVGLLQQKLKAIEQPSPGFCHFVLGRRIVLRLSRWSPDCLRGVEGLFRLHHGENLASPFGKT